MKGIVWMKGEGMNLARELAEYVLGIEFAHLGFRTVKETKARIVDALGCAVGAFHERPVEIARRTVQSIGNGGRSTLIGVSAKASPDLATFVNGLMVRYFDFNDTYLSKEPAHPSDNLAPCLAVGEFEDCSGR